MNVIFNKQNAFKALEIGKKICVTAGVWVAADLLSEKILNSIREMRKKNETVVEEV